MIKAVIFDLNGVFIQSPRLSDRYEKELGISVSEFLPVLKETMAQARLPNAPEMYVLWKPYLDKWGLNFTKEQFLDFWFKLEGGNQEMIDLVQDLKKKNLRLFILTNNFRERAMFYEENFPFMSVLFEKIYSSWQTGYIKPDKRAYETILKEKNLKPEEVAYFDDSEENTRAASSLGIQSYVFEGAHDVRRKLL